MQLHTNPEPEGAGPGPMRGIAKGIDTVWAWLDFHRKRAVVCATYAFPENVCGYPPTRGTTSTTGEGRAQLGERGMRPHADNEPAQRLRRPAASYLLLNLHEGLRNCTVNPKTKRAEPWPMCGKAKGTDAA